MKWQSSYLTELQKSLRPGAKAELVTARKMFGNRKSIGLGTIASYRMDPKQRMQRIHYAMACAKWGTLSDADKLAYATWADDNKVTVFSSFLHSYLSQLKEDLTLYLPMEKITGTTVKDFSTFANDGTEANTTLTKDGFIDNCLDFNGTSSEVNCGSDASLQFATSDFSLSAWFKTASAAHMTILGNAAAAAPGYYLYIHPTNHFIYFNLWGASGSGAANTGVAVDNDIWHHVSVTCDRSGNAIIYLNGLNKSSVDISGFGDITTVHPTYVGRTVNNPFYEGTIDEVRMYKKMFTPEEILTIYRQESKWHGDVA